MTYSPWPSAGRAGARSRHSRGAAGLVVVAGLMLAACQADLETPREPPAGSGAALPSGPIATVCGNTVPGPTSPPAGAVVVDSAVDSDLSAKTQANPPGTTFWLSPGRHTLGRDEFGSVAPKDGNGYIG